MSSMNKKELYQHAKGLYTRAHRAESEIERLKELNERFRKKLSQLDDNWALTDSESDSDSTDSEQDSDEEITESHSSLLQTTSILEQENEKLQEDKKYINDISDEYCKKWNEELKINEQLREELRQAKRCISWLDGDFQEFLDSEE